MSSQVMLLIVFMAMVNPVMSLLLVYLTLRYFPSMVLQNLVLHIKNNIIIIIGDIGMQDKIIIHC